MGLLLSVASAAVANHAPQAERAAFATSDGIEIVGDYFPPDGRAMAPAVILLHQYNADRSSWKPLVPKLHEAGFAVLAIEVSYWNWYQFPTEYLAGQALDHVAGGLVAGLVLAGFCRPG